MFGSLLKDTWWIFLIGLGGILVFLNIRKKIRNIMPYIETRQRNAEIHKDRIGNRKRSSLNETKFKDKLKNLNFWYTLYSNIVSVFPLLGMGGTVYSLLSLAQNSNSLSTVEMDSFFMALNTTIAGIICAVIGKIADSFISPDIADINKEYDLITQRNTAESKTGE